MSLSDAQLRALKPLERPKKHSDGGGLHVLITPKGSKLWRLAYRFEGKQKLLALGAYPAVTLSEARSRREDAKRLLATGIDPSEQARREKLERRTASAATFQAIAEVTCSPECTHSWASPVHVVVQCGSGCKLVWGEPVEARVGPV